jgi:hypothetical protein
MPAQAASTNIGSAEIKSHNYGANKISTSNNIII